MYFSIVHIISCVILLEKKKKKETNKIVKIDEREFLKKKKSFIW